MSKNILNYLKNNKMNDIKLFTKLCIYSGDDTILYGQHKNTSITSVTIKGKATQFINSKFNDDFCIIIKGKFQTIDLMTISTIRNSINLTNIVLEYPFENKLMGLDPKHSSIITTICKDYSHRLDEWIQYNLKLGFSAIVIFDNSENTANGLHESLKYCQNQKPMSEICKKYDNVLLVSCPYSRFEHKHWTSIQFVTFHIGVNQYRDKCKFIALIDSDEFIYLPKNPQLKIEDFLGKYNRTISIKSNILTNKNENDIIDNNILDLARYVGEDKYTKLILCTDLVLKNEFIHSPHKHQLEIKLNKDEIIHYHCWINDRYKYNNSLPKIDFLYDFLHS